MSPTTAPWWRSAVIYQVYIRSFADGNGDGVGDIAGIRSRLPYLKSLGVDALWINPWYKSPMADHGYDVADYREIDPLFGTVAEAEQLIEEAHAHGIRIVPDIVPNHSSDQHAWFRAALAAGPGSPERERFVFRPGRGPDGSLPPNDWDSRFGGPAWTRVADGEWYLHLFAPQQPDLNWRQPDVHAEFESVLRFWFEPRRGRLPYRCGPRSRQGPRTAGPGRPRRQRAHPLWDRDEVHDIYRAWRKVADEFPGDRAFVAEAWTDTPERLAAYLRPDGLHTAFNFDYLMASWDAEGPARRHRRHRSPCSARSAPRPPGCSPTTTSCATPAASAARPPGSGRPTSPTSPRPRWTSNSAPGAPAPPPCSRSPSPAAPTSTRARNSACPRWRTCPRPSSRTPSGNAPGTPTAAATAAGCRSRGPGGPRRTASAPAASATATPWLPQPADWAPYTVEAQTGDEASMLELYRARPAACAASIPPSVTAA